MDTLWGGLLWMNRGAGTTDVQACASDCSHSETRVAPLLSAIIDPNAWRLYFELRQKRLRWSVSRLARAAEISERTLRHRHLHDLTRPTDAEHRQIEDEALKLGARIRQPPTGCPLRLAGTLLFLAAELLAEQRAVGRAAARRWVWSRALGPEGWTRPEPRRNERNAILGPLFQFYRRLQLLAMPPAMRQNLTQPMDRHAIRAAYILWDRGGQPGQANPRWRRWLNDVMRESDIPVVEVPDEDTVPDRFLDRHDPWIHPDSAGWQPDLADSNESPLAPLAVADTYIWLDHAWEAALLSQRILGLVLWSISTTQRPPMRGQAMQWTGSAEPVWGLHWPRLTGQEWDRTRAIHGDLLHGQQIQTELTQGCWP